MKASAIKSSRLLFFSLFVLFLGAEIFIALKVHDRFIRPYLGDVLVIWVLYFGIRTLFPKPVPHLPGALFVLGCAVEVLQYFNLAQLPVINRLPAAQIILGSTFDLKDMICYGVGAVSIWCLEKQGFIHKNKD